jgi:EmrB/QacA subfamily drug resistance transporter
VTATASVKARSPWVPTSLVVLGTTLVVLDTTIVAVALSRIAVDLHVGVGIEWVATAYLLAVTAAQPVTGWLADRIGRKNLFLIALSVFVIASAGCASSSSLGMLVGFRTLQGLGGGAVAPLSTAMVLELFPKERHGRAVAVSTMAVMMTPAIGPTAGGLILAHASWHWLFLINVPIGVITVILAAIVVPQFGHRERRSFDWSGFVLGTGGLSLVVLALAQGNTWGWGSSTTALVLGGGLVLLALFVAHELRTPNPMVELRIFAHGKFGVATGAIFFMTMAQFGRTVFLPLELEGLRGFTPLRVGVLFILPAFAGMTGTFWSARLSERTGLRFPVVLGCIFSGLALVGMSRFTLTTSLVVVVALMVLQSSGMGLTITPSVVAGLSSLPPEHVAQGSALRSLTGQASGAFAIAIYGAVVASHLGAHPTAVDSQHAYNAAFAWGVVGVAISLVFATRLPRRAERRVALEPTAVPLID